MAGVSQGTRDRIYRKIMGDLDPHPLIVHAKLGSSIAVGGFLSLLLCGQFGLSLTPFAGAMHGQLMGLMGLVGCTVTCGLIFSFLPVLLLKVMSSPMQFYVLTRKKWGIVMTWMTGSGILFFVLQSSITVDDLILWTLTAGGTFFIFAETLGLMSRRCLEWKRRIVE